LACLFSILTMALVPCRPSFASHPTAHTLEEGQGHCRALFSNSSLVVTVCKSLKHSRVETDQMRDTSSGLWGRLQLTDSQHSFASDRWWGTQELESPRRSFLHSTFLPSSSCCACQDDRFVIFFAFNPEKAYLTARLLFSLHNSSHNRKLCSLFTAGSPSTRYHRASSS